MPLLDLGQDITVVSQEMNRGDFKDGSKDVPCRALGTAATLMATLQPLSSEVRSPTDHSSESSVDHTYGNSQVHSTADEVSPLKAGFSECIMEKKAATVEPESSATGNPMPPRVEKEKFIWVLDPLTRKLRVPISQIVPTQATMTSGTVPSLCIAFNEGRCRHPWCRQAHVQPSAIPQLRYEALNAPTCCSFHCNPHDIKFFTSRFNTITVTDSNLAEPIPTERVALTVGLQRYMAHTVPPTASGENLEIPSKLICRLHLSHRCRYLEDCNNIHLCREYELRLQPPPHMLLPLSTVTPQSRTVTVADTVYSVTVLAVGDVSDEKFAQLSEQQRQMPPPSWRESFSVNASRMSPLPLQNSMSLHGTPVLGGGFPSIPFGQIPSSTTILESFATGVPVGASGQVAAAASLPTTPVPAVESTPTQGFIVTAGDTPIPKSPLSAPPGGATSYSVGTRPLRIYDVRPRPTVEPSSGGEAATGAADSRASAQKATAASS